MIHIERNLIIDATPEAVWEPLSRYMEIDKFCTGISKVDALTTGEDGVGSKRRNNFPNGSSLIEEVTEWTVNRGYIVRMSEMVGLPMKDTTAFIRLESVGSKTRVVWGMDFGMKNGPLGWLMGQTMLRFFMGKTINSNLEGLAALVKNNSASNVSSIAPQAKRA
ncbi:MAG: SRPBCC family protein [Paracoccaceae bacterium]|nr:SRPBCC family protein [Paracoccaceae bacterium]MDG1738658.1 SRPBCC family protein [Paracoccaceae bacterium]